MRYLSCGGTHARRVELGSANLTGRVRGRELSSDNVRQQPSFRWGIAGGIRTNATLEFP
jgi:hypothetical protein